MTHAADEHFESRKNMQAGSITLAILVLLFLFLFLVGWSTPSLLQPVPEEGIEVNLGNSDAGLGNDQPFEPGKPAPQDRQQYTPPRPVAETQKEAVKDPATDDKDPDAPEIKKPPVTKPEATKIAEKEESKKTPPKKIETPAPPAPVPPRPKAIFKGVNGTGTGGNEADSYKKGGNEGIAGGRGDQGRPGGNPDSKNYTGGGHGNSGVSIARGLEGRRWTSLPSFEDDFNENAKIAVDIRVDANGSVTSAIFQQRGSTSGDASLKSIAIRKALQIKFNNTGSESSGTIIFNFKLKN